MKVISAMSKEATTEFLNFPNVLFAKDENYIRSFNQDIENVFNPKKNKFFKFGECERFLFKNQEKKTVGKIAVFINKEYKQSQPTSGIGFFDCIDNQQTAGFIFNLQRIGFKKKKWKRWIDRLI